MKKRIKLPIIAIVTIILIIAPIRHYRRFISPSQNRNVLIESTKSGLLGKTYSIGSGTIIGNRAILTAKHCLENTCSVRATLPDNTTVIIDTFYTDPNNDIGLFFVDYNATSVEFCSPKFGDFVYCIGNSKGIWRNYVYFGFVYDTSFKREAINNEELILLWMDVEPGASGGGVYKNGKLVGIVSRKANRATLIVPAKICEKFYKKIIKKRQEEILTWLWSFEETFCITEQSGGF